MSQYEHKYDRTTQGGPRTLINPQSGTLNQWFGDVQVSTRFMEVTCPMVSARSRISVTPFFLAYGISSGATGSPVFGVGSVLVGSGFWLQTVNSVAVFSGAINLHWELRNPA